MNLKNEKLTGVDEDTNIRQENLDILKMKHDQTQAQGEADTLSKARNSVNDFRMPNIQRILQNQEVDQKGGRSLPGETDQKMQNVYDKGSNTKTMRMNFETGKGSLHSS